MNAMAPVDVSASEVFDALRACVSTETLIREDEPLARKTTLRVGGPAEFYAEPASEGDLALLLGVCHDHSVPVTVLGRGSNFLVRDGGVAGLVLCLKTSVFSEISVENSQLCCGAGARLREVAALARKNRLSGMEFLEGIPGSIGGGLRMNAGAMGSEMFDVVKSVRFMDQRGRIFEKSATEIEVRYRDCCLFALRIVLDATLMGTPDSEAAIAGRMNAFSQKRRDSQPAALSAGCIFRNPPAIPAGKLVDELGLKGARVGGAKVSNEHGNFIVNTGEATANDVLELIELIQKEALKKQDIELQTEVRIIGR